MNLRISITLVLLIFSASPIFAKTGIIEIYTTPPGAEVFIDNIYAGLTPFTDPDIEIGPHQISLKIERTEITHNFSVEIDNINPQIYRINLQELRPTFFNGVIEKPTLIVDRGNIQFASIPTGAQIKINEKEMAKTPVSFRDVDTGSYQVKFLLDGKVLEGEFKVYKNETSKLIADFKHEQIIDKGQEEISKLKRQEKGRTNQALKQKELAREEHVLHELEDLQPEVREKILRARDQQHLTIPVEEMYNANRSYYYIALNLDPTVVSYYKLPYDRLTLELKNLKKGKSARLGDYYEGEYVFRYGKHTRRGRLNSSNLASCRFTLYNELTIKVRYDPDDYGAGRGKGKVFVSVR
jgi:hypothetical protein